MNMAEIVKFVYVIIFIIYMFFVSTNIEGNLFLSFSNFLIYFVKNISSQFSYILLFSYFITARLPQPKLVCRIDYDCIAVKCPTVLVPKCINGKCDCIEISAPIDYVLT